MQKILRLHWKLFFPLVALLWLIIGIAICYFVTHERQRQKENLENRLLNVNNTVVDAYDRGVDMQKTVDFIRLFTDNTTLAPLRITVYDNQGSMVADNAAETISLYGPDGKPDSDLLELISGGGQSAVHDIEHDGVKSMVSFRISDDGRIYSFAALPYEGEVIDFMSTDPMVWVMVILLGLVSSVLAYLGVRTICQNVYSLRDYANAIATDSVPADIDSLRFSDDELGDVSRNIITIYRDKIHAEQEKMHFERQIGLNVSHELNTPVGIIKGYIDTVLDDKDMSEEMKRRFLTRAKENTDRLASLVGDISMMMRLQESGGSITTTAVDFHILTRRIAEDVVQGHVADNMTFDWYVPEGCMVTGHESLLTNALLNLIYNAAQHSGGTAMSLRWLGEADGYHTFAFADNGRGVDRQHLERLFDMFYRVDAGRSRKTGGSGLGLSLVSRIITSMGGTITVEDNEPSGLRFIFTLRSAS